MADEPLRERRGRRAVTTAVLAGVVAVAGAVGLIVSVLQRPPIPVRSPPTAIPAPPTTATPIPTPIAGGPVSAFGFSVADDPAIHQVVLFGGVDTYNDTWLWDGGRWSLARPASSPPGRFLAAAAYDPVSTLVMVFGGRLAQGELVNDTWAWDGAAWHELNNGAGAPPPDEGALMAWDDANRDMVLVTPSTTTSSGETWIWSGDHWSRRAGGDLPTTPVAGEMAFDYVTHALLLVSPLLPPSGVGPTTWSWSGTGWRRLPAAPPTATTGLAVDPASGGRLVLCSDPTGAAPARLWSWSGEGWQPVAGSALSAELAVEVTDIDRSQLLMLGFASPASQIAPQPLHVWEWSPSGWHQLY